MTQSLAQAMTATEIEGLPPLVDLPTAARALGLGRTAAYTLVRTNDWPTPVIRLGRLIRIPTAPLKAMVAGNQRFTVGPGGAQ